MRLIRFFLFLLLASTLAGQTANVTKNPSTNAITGDLTIGAGKTLTLSGVLTGTPTGGSLNFSNVTVTGLGAGSGDLLSTNNLSDVASAATSRENLKLVYTPADVAVSGNIAVWANSMGITGSSTPWPTWLGIRTGRPVYNGSVAGETSTQIKARFDAATSKWGYFTIFDVARNDSSFTTTKANLAAMIASLGHTRYLVIGVLCRQSTPIGNAQHTADLALNAELLALYGSRFYDPQSYLVGLWDPNVAQDVTDYSNDVFPSSLEYSNDGTHLNSAGHIAQADVITPIVLHSVASSSSSFTTDVSITKSAPTLTLTNTGAGTGAFALATTAAAGQFRVTEVGVADRFVISKTTGYAGFGTTSPQSPFVISNGGAAGIEFTPSSGNILGYDRGASYSPLSLTGSTLTFNIGASAKLSISAGGNTTVAGALASGAIAASYTGAVSTFTRVGTNGGGAVQVLNVYTDGKTASDGQTLMFNGLTSTDAVANYGSIKTSYTTTTNGSMASSMAFGVQIAGTLTDVLTLAGTGMTVPVASSFTGATSFTGIAYPVFTAMGALAVDMTKAGNSYSATGNVTFTYSAATPTAGTSTLLRITADSTDRTITIPTTWSITRGGNITSLLVPASTTLQVKLQYLSSRWEILGDPPATTGSGSYVLSAGTLAVTSGKTLTATNSLTLSGTDSTTMTFPSTSQTVVGLTATQTLSGKQYAYTAAHGTDDTYEGTTITGLNAGATIAQWELVYLGGSSTWLLADANGSGTYPTCGMAVAAYSSTNPAVILTRGTVRNDAWNWTPGGRLYMSTTAGGLTQTAPSTSGDKVQDVGFALTADIAYVDFNGVYLTVQ